MLIIERIEDVLPSIEGRSEFVVLEKDGYTAIDYVFQQDDTFADPICLECRGIKFGPDGYILARPLHKFFNLGEREQPHEVDFGRPHVVLEKMDGSMVHAAMMEDGVVLMTRKGRTDVARQAEDLFLRKFRYLALMQTMMKMGFTPIFEYVGPQNRIVLRYEEPSLVLLAARHTILGTYMPYWELSSIAGSFDLPVVDDGSRGESVTAVGPNVESFVAGIRALQDKEGVVIQFADGHMLKIKAEEYVMQHRALDDMSSKKKVAALVLQGFEDDLMPVLDEADAAELKAFAAKVRRQVSATCDYIHRAVDRHGTTDRKTLATTVVNRWRPHLRAAFFKCLDGQDPAPVLLKTLQRHTDLIIAKWRGK